MALKTLFLIASLTSASSGCLQSPITDNSSTKLSAREALGKRLFFDASLSEPEGQSCSSCHNPQAAFSSPQLFPLAPVTEGAHRGLFGNRNAPTVKYAAYIPARSFDEKEETFVGGLFLDGRENSLEDQASGPVFNPVEMGVSTSEDFYKKLKIQQYQLPFESVFGENSFSSAKNALTSFTQAVAAYQRSSELNPFSSKYDAYLNGKAVLSEQEKRGLNIFEDEDKGNCAACHPNKPNKNKQPPLFTDFTYDNLGVPANPNNPFYEQNKKFNSAGKSYIDNGLGNIVKDKKQNGKFRVPTLRNIEKTAPYMHNGVFSTLDEVVDFYNTRDVNDWPKAEVELNVNKDELGDLKLTKKEEQDLVVFLKTLTDGYKSK